MMEGIKYDVWKHVWKDASKEDSIVIERVVIWSCSSILVGPTNNCLQLNCPNFYID